MTFIKSQDTKATVANSRTEIERMLRRYGASGFNVAQTFDKQQLADGITISFIIPDKPGSEKRVPISLSISVKRVYDALHGEPTERIWQGNLGYVAKHDPNGYKKDRVEKAERVAWRNLVLWIDAALSAAAIGLQTITEAFYAHTVVQLEGGGQARLADYLEMVQGQLAPGIRALLAAPAEDS